jgi:hypothetical protein
MVDRIMGARPGHEPRGGGIKTAPLGTSAPARLGKKKGAVIPPSRRLRGRAPAGLGEWGARHAIAREVRRWPNQASPRPGAQAVPHGTSMRYLSSARGPECVDAWNSRAGSLVVRSPVPLCPFKWDRNSPLTAPHSKEAPLFSCGRERGSRDSRIDPAAQRCSFSHENRASRRQAIEGATFPDCARLPGKRFTRVYL